MAIKYTIREVTPHSITVDYEDGAWAIVPLRSDMNRSQLETFIADFNHSDTTFNSVEEVPFEVGEEVVAKSSKDLSDEAQQNQKQQVLTYKEIRSFQYPPVGDQLDALYWARTGDETQLNTINDKIAEVKQTYPKDMPTMTREEYELMLEQIANNVLG